MDDALILSHRYESIRKQLSFSAPGIAEVSESLLLNYDASLCLLHVCPVITPAWLSNQTRNSRVYHGDVFRKISMYT